MSKQTAVEWLVKKLNQEIDYIPLNKWDVISDIIQEAIAMEKEQIMKTVDVGFEEGSKFIEDIKFTNAEHYYNETFVSKDSKRQWVIEGMKLYKKQLKNK